MGRIWDSAGLSDQEAIRISWWSQRKIASNSSSFETLGNGSMRLWHQSKQTWRLTPPNYIKSDHQKYVPGYCNPSKFSLYHRGELCDLGKRFGQACEQGWESYPMWQIHCLRCEIHSGVHWTCLPWSPEEEKNALVCMQWFRGLPFLFHNWSWKPLKQLLNYHMHPPVSSLYAEAPCQLYNIERIVSARTWNTR